MPLKYLITSKEFNRNVLTNPSRGDGLTEAILGLKWDIITDTIVLNTNYSIFGKSRGKTIGTLLK